MSHETCEREPSNANTAPDTRREQARALRMEGRAIREIAAELGVPRSTVSDWMRSQGGERLTNKQRQHPLAACKVCGAPTISKIGICFRTPQCRNEAVCHRKGYTKRLRCAGCGGPMRSNCKWRFCTRNRQCRSLHDAEMRRVDGERFREAARRSLVKHAQKYRARQLIHRRLRGVRPANLRGRNNPAWTGGRIVFCFVCGQCAGWRHPSQLRRRKRFLCKSMDVKAGNGTCRTTGTNPNELFNQCLKQAALAERCAAEALRSRERVRRALYRAAVAYQELAREHHQWFLAQANSVGGIDILLEAWFRPLAFFGEDWHDLLRDVAEGMTETEYLASTAGSFLRRRKVAALVNRENAESPLPAEPERSLPAEERVAFLEEQNRTLKQQVLAARKQAAELRRIAARQERRIAELETVLNKIEKATVRLKAG